MLVILESSSKHNMLAISVLSLSLSLSLFLFFLSYDYGFPLSVFFAVAQLTTKIKHLSSVLHKKVTIEPIISLFQSILDYFHCIIYPKRRRRVFSLYYFSVYLFIYYYYNNNNNNDF